ncbi:MAG: hypothetical protein ACPK85_05965 [Methanosarcina sp.]
MRKFIKYGIFLFGGFIFITLNASAVFEFSDKKIEDKNIEPENYSEGFGIDICINFEPYTHEELSKYSDTIVIGTVKETLPPKWNTANGKQPNKSITELGSENVIYTDIIIDVDEYLKNPLSSKELIVRVIGGSIGNVNMTTHAEPNFSNGEKVLLYLKKDVSPYTKNIGPEHFIVTNFYQAKFKLTESGRAVRLDENITLEELLNTINKTDNKLTKNTAISNNTGFSVKQKENSDSTLVSKKAFFINPFLSVVTFFAAACCIGRMN